MKKLLYKILICFWKGHNYVKTQYPDWPYYYQLQCSRCRYLDKEKHISPVIMKKQDDKVIVTVSGAGGGGSTGNDKTVIIKDARMA